jgi:acyl carrier protein
MARTREEFLGILVRHLGAVDRAEDIAPDVKLRMLGLNSMRAVDLVMDLEDGFDISFPDESFTDEVFETADSIWTVVLACATAGQRP